MSVIGTIAFVLSLFSIVLSTITLVMTARRSRD